MAEEEVKEEEVKEEDEKEELPAPELFDAEQTKQAKTAFDAFDKDGDGKISETETASVMRSLGHNPSSNEIKELFTDIGTDGSGGISFEEFLLLFKKYLTEGDTEDVIIDAFRTFDQGQHGKILATELIHVLKSLGDPMSQEDIDDMISQSGKDEDGFIDYKEFVHRIMNS